MSMTSRDWVLPPKPKPGRKPLQSSSEREARNRATQRAFRERRKALVAELREELRKKQAEFREKEAGYAKKEETMTRRIQDLEQQLSVSQKRCEAFATTLGRNFLDDSTGNPQNVQEDMTHLHQDRRQSMDEVQFELDTHTQPGRNNQGTRHPSPGALKTIPRNVASATVEECEAQVASSGMNENGDDAVSSVHPELFEDPLLDNLSLSPVSSTYGYLHPGLDDAMQNSPLDLDDTELRQFSLSRSSF